MGKKILKDNPILQFVCPNALISQAQSHDSFLVILSGSS